jgi:hypothetical protein
MDSVAARLRSRQGLMEEDDDGVRKGAAGTFLQKPSGETLPAWMRRGETSKNGQNLPKGGLHYHLSGWLSARPRKKGNCRAIGQPAAAA